MKFIVVVLFIVRFSNAAECHGKVTMLFVMVYFIVFLQPDPNAKPNANPIQTGALQFIKSVKNGKLYMAGSGEEAIPIVHVWGELQSHASNVNLHTITH